LGREIKTNQISNVSTNFSSGYDAAFETDAAKPTSQSLIL
jgi:hypothetical protein